MSLRSRIVEIAYKLKDDFSNRVNAVVGSFKRLETAADKGDGALARFQKRLGGVGRVARGITKVIKGALVAAFAALVTAAASVVTGMRSFSESLDEATKAARSLGETTENLTALQHAAALSGLGAKQLTKGLQQMVRSVSEAAEGTGEAAGALGELGLSAQRLEQMRPAEQLAQIAAALGDIENQSDRVRIAEKLFGARNATGFLNLLEQGADGLQRMTDEARQLGIVYSAEEAAKLERYNDNWERLSRTWDSLLNRGRLKIADFFNSLVDSAGAQGLLTTANDLETVQRQIDSLWQTIESTRRAREGFWTRLLVPEGRMRGLLEQMDRLLARRKALYEESLNREKQAEQERQEREHNRKMAQLYKEGSDAFKKALGERKAAYAKSLSELRVLQAQEKAIAEEFKTFVREVQAGPGDGSGPAFFDAGLARTAAQRALNAGDFEEAIKQARKAKELVEALSESGNESTVSLLGLAKSIERIANAAAAGRTKAKQSELEEQKRIIDDIEQRLKNLPKIKVQFDERALAVEMDRIQALLDRRPLVVQVQPRDQVAGFGGQADVERTIEEIARRRGDR